MQFGPSIAAPTSRARRARRSVVGSLRSRLGADPGNDERADARRDGLLEGSLDALVVHHQERGLGCSGRSAKLG